MEISTPVPSGSTPADLRIESVTPKKPLWGETLDFHVLAESPEAQDYIIPVRLYVDRDINGDEIAYDDVLGELRFIYYGEGYISYQLNLGIYTPGIFNFTVEVEEQGSLFFGSDSILVEVVETPSIWIYEPQSNDVFGTVPPSVNVQFNAYVVDTTEYQLYNDSINTGYYNWTGNIKQNIWNMIGHGYMYLKFYLSDNISHSTTKSVRIFKDLKAPVLETSHFDYITEFYDISPEFQLIVHEDNIDQIWYTLNNGSKHFSGNDIKINQTEWDKLPYEQVNITLYANDTLGRETHKIWIVYKREKSEENKGEQNNNDTPSSQTIIGYDNLLLFVSIFAVITIFRKKRLIIRKIF